MARPFVMTRFAAIAAAIAMSVAVAGCGHRYADASDSAYDIATALVSAASLERPSAVAKVSDAIDRELAAGRLAESEAAYLRAIATQCEAGEWDAANREAREVLKAQIKRL